MGLEAAPTILGGWPTNSEIDSSGTEYGSLFGNSPTCPSCPGDRVPTITPRRECFLSL